MYVLAVVTELRSNIFFTYSLSICSHWKNMNTPSDIMIHFMIDFMWMNNMLLIVVRSIIIIIHHHIVLVARISLTLSRHSSLSFIALGRSSGQHPIPSHSCWMYVRAGRPAFARPCVGIHKSTSLMSSSLLLQQCPACLVRLTWIVFCDRG